MYDTYFFIEDGDSPRLLEITGRALFAAEYGDEASNPHAYASSDASSAAFLSLLRAYVGRYGGLGRFSDRLTEIDRIAGAMLATYDEALGLTACKGADSDRLLVNNCIVYRGCIDAAWLYRVLPDCAEKAAEMDGYASRLREGIETHLWDATAGRYRTAVSASGRSRRPTPAHRTSFAQLYPLLCGLPEADGERGQALYAAFRADGLDDWFAQTAGADTGAALGLAVLKVGDAESAPGVYRRFTRPLRGCGLSLPVLRGRRRTGSFNHRRPACALSARRGIGRAVLRGGVGSGGTGGRQRAARRAGGCGLRRARRRLVPAVFPQKEENAVIFASGASLSRPRLARRALFARRAVFLRAHRSIFCMKKRLLFGRKCTIIIFNADFAALPVRSFACGAEKAEQGRAEDDRTECRRRGGKRAGERLYG